MNLEDRAISLLEIPLRYSQGKVASKVLVRCTSGGTRTERNVTDILSLERTFCICTLTEPMLVWNGGPDYAHCTRQPRDLPKYARRKTEPDNRHDQLQLVLQSIAAHPFSVNLSAHP